MTAARSRAALGLALACCAIVACERASFESLGMRRATMTHPVDLQEAGELDAESELAGSSASPVDAGIVTPLAGIGAPVAGSGGASGMAAAGGRSGTAEVDAGTGAAGAAGTAGELVGTFPPKTFDSVKSGFVVGRSDELGTTTAYLLDHSVTCDEISKFAWLAGLPEDVQVLEIMFPSSAKTGTPVTGSIISHAQGGMYSFSKTIANMRMLVLSRNETAGVVEGALQATFSSGAVSGVFHAEFCATGMSF
jgi:hypothetical protein